MHVIKRNQGTYCAATRKPEGRAIEPPPHHRAPPSPSSARAQQGAWPGERRRVPDRGARCNAPPPFQCTTLRQRGHPPLVAPASPRPWGHVPSLPPRRTGDAVRRRPSRSVSFVRAVPPPRLLGAPTGAPRFSADVGSPGSVGSFRGDPPPRNRPASPRAAPPRGRSFSAGRLVGAASRGAASRSRSRSLLLGEPLRLREVAHEAVRAGRQAARGERLVRVPRRV